MYITRRVYISVGLNCTPAGITFSHVFYNIDADDSVDSKYFIYVSQENNGRLPCKNQPSVTVAQFSCCCGEIEVKKRQIKLAWIHPSLYVYE